MAALLKPKDRCACGEYESTRKKCPERWECDECGAIRTSRKQINYIDHNKGVRFCARCDGYLPLDEFYERNAGYTKPSYSHLCKFHTKEASAEYRTQPTNREKIKRWAANQTAKKLAELGLSPKDYNRVLKAQKKQCAICGTRTPGGRWNKFNFDHDHDTNQVRGLLCHLCNRLLGQIGDSFDAAAPIIDYLIRGLRKGDCADFALESKTFAASNPNTQDWLNRWLQFCNEHYAPSS